MEADLLPFNLRYFLVKSQKRWIFLKQLFGYLRSIFNAENLHIIVTESITIKSVDSTTLKALWKPIYHRLSCAIFWQDRKNAGFSFDNYLSIWGQFSTLKIFTSLQLSQLQSNQGLKISNSFLKANSSPFKLRHFLAKSQKTLDFLWTIIRELEVRFQRWKSSHYRSWVNYNQISGFNNYNSLVEAILPLFNLRHFLVKSQKRWIFFKHLFGCLRSVFNA